MSRRTKNAGDSDTLLNHWGVYHLHMGRTLCADGFISRTNHLLFCRFTADSAFLLDVHPHEDAWSRSVMMEIVHENWPETIAHWRAHGIARQSLTDAKIANLQKKGLNYVLSMPDGTVYFLPGGGTTLAGSNLVDTLVVGCLKDWGAKESWRLANDWSNIKAAVVAEGVDVLEPVQLELWFDGSEYRALEAAQRFCINLLQPEGHCPTVTLEQISRIRSNHA